MTGVTGNNYSEKGKLFIQLNPDKIATIIQRSSSKTDAAGNQLQVTTESLRQWGAWRAYFKKIGRALHHFDRSDYYTVPAAWPHLFDADATVQEDHAIADEYLDFVRRRKNQEHDYRNPISQASIKKMVSDFKGPRGSAKAT